MEHKSLVSDKLKRDKFPPRRDNKADVSSVSSSPSFFLFKFSYFTLFLFI